MLQNTIGSASLAKMTVMELMTQIEKTAVKRQSDLLNKICADTPIQERVESEKSDRYSDDINEVSAQETDDGNHNPVQHYRYRIYRICGIKEIHIGPIQ